MVKKKQENTEGVIECHWKTEQRKKKKKQKGQENNPRRKRKVNTGEEQRNKNFV